MHYLLLHEGTLLPGLNLHMASVAVNHGIMVYTYRRKASLYNFDFSYLTLFILMLTIFYLYKFFRLEYSKRNIIRYGIPAFLLLSGFIAANIYKLMSGTFLREGAYLILLLIITSESFYIIKNVMEYYSKLKLRINSMIVLLLFSLSFCLYTGISEALKCVYRIIRTAIPEASGH